MNTPYGGGLVDLIVGPDRAAEMKAEAKDHPSLTLDDRSLCDLELLAVGGFSPLTGFLGEADYDRVVGERRLADGTFWPLPVTLPLTPGEGIDEGKTLALRDVYGNLLAFLHLEEIYRPDKGREAALAYGTVDRKPPPVEHLDRTPGHYAAGRLEVIRTPPHYDFVDLRRTPAELRDRLASLGWSKVVAAHGSGLLLRAGEEAARLAARRIGGGLLINPVVGVTRPGDAGHYTRVRCYRALVDGDGPCSPVLNLLPLAGRMAGPGEALLRAIVRRNYGCTHMLVGPGHAGPEADPAGQPSYPPHAALEAMAEHADEIGVQAVESEPMVYLPDDHRYCPAGEVPRGAATVDMASSGMLEGRPDLRRELPDWSVRPAVAEILAQASPPKDRQGLTVWFTGLSGSGKSTVAHALVERLAEHGRRCALLDGDEIRTHLSRGLTFSKEDRDINIRRVGYVAGLVCQAGGTTLCSVISPYRAIRDEAREASRGNFVEVYCSTPIEVCELRDVKGMYAKARAAVAASRPLGFTGVDDPYEPPVDPEVSLDTSRQSVEECVEAIVRKLLDLGYILPH
ncbi:adenylyl-sulfate kinase [Aquisphaera giovannonii]|uniref:adenylyl-sulfate kinase n=1 Tax=Aquisphaera giovannonii TaxID=406548 RepID=UPI0011E02F5F|nr:adenylyl-sulfate kinase [Aquisphaera giovannonii]